MRHLLVLFAVVLIGCDSSEPVGKKTPLKEGPLSAEESAQIIKAEKIGKAIYLQDLIAAQATDVVLSRPADSSLKTVKGWIVTRDNEGYLVRFINETNKEMRPVFDVRITADDQKTFHDKNLPPLSDEQKAMFLARQNALKSALLRCSDRHNTVVLSDPDSDNWLVYVLAATTNPHKIIVGGHSRVSVSKDGKKVISVTPLSKSCLTIDKSNIPKAASPAAFYVSHVIDDTPSETHVYLNYLHGYDIYVVTETRFWHISKGEISVFNP
jgi:hypothetical protein